MILRFLGFLFLFFFIEIEIKKKLYGFRIFFFIYFISRRFILFFIFSWFPLRFFLFSLLKWTMFGVLCLKIILLSFFLRFIYSLFRFNQSLLLTVFFLFLFLILVQTVRSVKLLYNWVTIGYDLNAN